MAQLSDDCFAFGGSLLTIDDALRIIAAETRCVTGIEAVPLLQADGRTLAHDVVAPVDLPPFDNAAVDGYAVRLADLDRGPVLPVVGRLAAGAPADAALESGSTRRIFTGAALPDGADTVFMQEDVHQEASGAIRFPRGLRRGANTRTRGEDVMRGALALPAGRVLRAQDLGLAAALGLRELPARRPVQVALFSTGDELVEPGLPVLPAQRYDANRVLLSALLSRAGASVTDLGILPDRREVIAAELSACADRHDLVLTSGGVSTGEEDHVRAAIEANGRVMFWRLAIKPGRPVAMGSIRGTRFVGLPGNPVAAFVTFVSLVRPLIAALGGSTLVEPPDIRVRAAFSYRKKAGRREYLRVRIAAGAEGWDARKHPVEGAGILASLTESDGLAELAETVTAVSPGDPIRFLPYGLIT